MFERVDTSVPLWWLVLAGPVAIALGAARKRKSLIGMGLAGSTLATAAMIDIAASPIVPGANDNLTAVAVLVALAERLRAEPMRACG